MQKDELNPFERAELISRYKELKGLSLTGLSQHLDIPKTTLHGWLSYLNTTEKDYQLRLDNGESKTDLFNELRCNSKDTRPADFHLKKAITYLRRALRSSITEMSFRELEEIKNITGKIETKVGKLKEND